MNTTKKANNKRMMLIFVAVFLLPVLLAKLALENGWFNEASTNKGELIQPPMDLSIIQNQEKEPKWKLLYVLPEQCSAKCENALYSIVQVWTALGKKSDRAEVVVVTHEKSNQKQVELLKEQTNVSIIKSELQSVNQVFKDHGTDGIFIADTLGNVILRYPLQTDPKQAVLHSRDILSDIRKVLKLSRIG